MAAAVALDSARTPSMDLSVVCCSGLCLVCERTVYFAFVQLKFRLSRKNKEKAAWIRKKKNRNGGQRRVE